MNIFSAIVVSKRIFQVVCKGGNDSAEKTNLLFSRTRKLGVIGWSPLSGREWAWICARTLTSRSCSMSTGSRGSGRSAMRIVVRVPGTGTGVPWKFATASVIRVKLSMLVLATSNSCHFNGGSGKH